MKRTLVVIALAAVLVGCSAGPAEESATGPSPVRVGDPMPGHVRPSDPNIGMPIPVSLDAADGEPIRGETKVLATEWIPADRVHGSSETWIGDAEVYLAVDVEYRSTSGTLTYSTADWSFEGADSASAPQGAPGPESIEAGKGLAVAGEVGAGTTVTGRLWFGLPTPVDGTLRHTDLAGTESQWSIPTR